MGRRKETTTFVDHENSPFPSIQALIASLSKRNHTYEKKFNLHVNEISFSYERMGTKTRFKKRIKVIRKCLTANHRHFGAE